MSDNIVIEKHPPDTQLVSSDWRAEFVLRMHSARTFDKE
jgi:hypothetical protein